MEHAPPSGGWPERYSAKMFLADEAGRYLLLKRSCACRTHAGKWDLPGGKVEPGEPPDDALRREIEEETGLRVVVDGMLGERVVELDDHRLVYRVLRGRVAGGVLQLSGEHDGHEWVPAGELSAYDLVPHFVPYALALAAGVLPGE